MLRYIQTFFLFLVLVGSLFAQDQQRIDSLYLELDFADKTEDKYELYKQILKEIRFNNPDEALLVVEDFLNLSKEKASTTNIAYAMLKKAEIYIILEQFDTAYNISNNLVKFASDNGLDFYHAEALTYLGRIFIVLQDYSSVPEYYFQAIEIYEKIGDLEGIMYVYNNLGILFQIEGNYEKNLEYKQKALELAQELNDSTVLGASLINLSKYYYDIKDYKKAIRYGKRALEVNTATNNRLYLSNNYHQLGESFLMSKKYEESLSNYHKSLIISKELQDSSHISNALSSIATVYDSLNQIDLALNYADSAYIVAMQNSAKDMQKKAAFALQSLYSKSNEHHKAYEYLSIYSHLSDSLNKEYDHINVLQNEMFYNVEKLKQKHILEENRKRFINNIIILSLVFSLLIIISFFMRQRLKAKNVQLMSEKLQNDLEHKNREMTSSVMALMKKNEILGDIATELIALEKSAVKAETKNAIGVIAQKIRNSRDVKLWEEFDRRFKEVHSEFNENLIKDYPDLSPGDLRLCALLKMNMSTKDISELTGSSPGSIDTGRYRLRKKLGLTTDDNIVIFLSKY